MKKRIERRVNKGAKLGNFSHNTGEGSVSPYHLEHGGDLVWQIGTGYFGCRDENFEHVCYQSLCAIACPYARLVGGTCMQPTAKTTAGTIIDNDDQRQQPNSNHYSTLLK